jgi:hypothetical protein
MSKIKVNSIEAATGSTITIPSGQTLDISSTTLTLPSTVVTTTGTQTLTNKTIGVSQLSGTLPVANGGTGLTTLGSASQVLRVNSGATALEYGTVATGANAGEVIQVVQSTKTDTASWSATTTKVDTGLSASITPSASANKILILWQLNIGYADTVNQWFIHLDRGGTEINLGDAAASKKRANSTHNVYSATAQDYMAVTTSGMFLDSPATTSSTTYKLQHSGATTSGTFYINRSNRDGDYTAYDGRFVSNIILMEVKG